MHKAQGGQWNQRAKPEAWAIEEITKGEIFWIKFQKVRKS